MFTLDLFHYDKFDVILKAIFKLRIYKVQIHVRGPYRPATLKQEENCRTGSIVHSWILTCNWRGKARYT